VRTWHTPTCEPCRAANRAKQAEYRARRVTELPITPRGADNDD
jgi:hypothetical protein